MYRICEECHRGFNDENQNTICPHSPLGHVVDDLCPHCDTLRSVHGPCIHQQPEGSGAVIIDSATDVQSLSSFESQRVSRIFTQPTVDGKPYVFPDEVQQRQSDTIMSQPSTNPLGVGFGVGQDYPNVGINCPAGSAVGLSRVADDRFAHHPAEPVEMSFGPISPKEAEELYASMPFKETEARIMQTIHGALNPQVPDGPLGRELTDEERAHIVNIAESGQRPVVAVDMATGQSMSVVVYPAASFDANDPAIIRIRDANALETSEAAAVVKLMATGNFPEDMAVRVVRMVKANQFGTFEYPAFVNKMSTYFERARTRKVAGSEMMTAIMGSRVAGSSSDAPMLKGTSMQRSSSSSGRKKFSESLDSQLQAANLLRLAKRKKKKRK